MQTVEYKINEQGIVTLVLDVKGQESNVLSTVLMDDLESSIDKINQDDKIKGVIITSAKNDFMVASDVNGVKSTISGSEIEEKFATSRRFSLLLRSLELCGKPVVVALNGSALGSGLELALAGNYCIATDDSQAVVGLPEVTLGLSPSAGGTQRLPRMIGLDQSLPLLMQGGSISFQEAKDLGIINELVAKDQLLASAEAWLLSDQAVAEKAWDIRGYKFDNSVKSRGDGTFMIQSSLLLTQTIKGGMTAAPKAILCSLYEGGRISIDKALSVESQYALQLIETLG